MIQELNYNPIKKEFYFSRKEHGLILFASWSKNQKRKHERYGIIPKNPTHNLSLWRYTDRHIQVSKSYKHNKNHRLRYHVPICGVLKRCNKMEFLDLSDQKVDQEIGVLFAKTFIYAQV